MDYLVHHMLRRSAVTRPDHTALVCGPRRLSYAQLETAVRALASSLQNAGLSRGQRVAILLEPGIEQTVSIFAASTAQAVFVPIHHSLKPDQVTHICADCDVSALITTKKRWLELQNHLHHLPSLQFVVLTDILAEDDQAPIPVYAFERFVSVSSASSLCESAIDKDLAAILYTSGSTGKPKGVMLSHANVIAGAQIVADYLRITQDDRILAVLPFSFDAGLNQLTTAILKGATLVISQFRFARDVLAELTRERITGLAGVPPFWNLFVQPSSGLTKTHLPDLRYITNTGGAMPQSTLALLRQGLPGTQVFLMYGLTEAFRSTYLPPDELDRRPTSMGKAIPNTEILVLREDGSLCGPGETGELVHHGPTVSLGYWGQEELTARVLRPHPFAPPGSNSAVKVCYSGDLVKTDDDGYLYFVGRRDNLIKSSGFRISPTEVEAALCRHTGIREAAVVGIPDELLGQSIKAYVVAVDGTELEEDEIIALASEVMPRYMVPKSVEILEQLPKTSSGKIDYPTLRKRAEQTSLDPALTSSHRE